jgi:hypothetical protein
VADGTVLHNTAAFASTATTDSNAANDSSSADTTVAASAALSVTKSAPVGATAGAAGGFAYTITVHNGGPSNNVGWAGS